MEDFVQCLQNKCESVLTNFFWILNVPQFTLIYRTTEIIVQIHSLSILFHVKSIDGTPYSGSLIESIIRNHMHA